jgi:sugar lactone lactonase YvrE
MPELRTLVTGLAFGESPRWHDVRLWLCDWGTQEVVAVDPGGKREVIVRVPAARPELVEGHPEFVEGGQGPLSIDWLPDGRLLIVSGRDRLLLRRERDGSLVTHADLSSLSNYSWNEIVVDGRGNAYVNSIGFDFPGGEFATGILALVTPGGSVRQVAGGVSFPNGMVVTPDNATLILAESYANRLTAFDIGADGSLSNQRIWADLAGNHPDGICLDAEGAVWYADVPAKSCSRVREGGAVLQAIELDRGCFACMLGGADRKTLFMVATEWGRPANTAGGARTGQVLSSAAPAPRAGWP